MSGIASAGHHPAAEGSVDLLNVLIDDYLSATNWADALRNINEALKILGAGQHAFCPGCQYLMCLLFQKKATALTGLQRVAEAGLYSSQYASYKRMLESRGVHF